MLSLNSKHVQHIKINLAGNLKVNLITHLEVIMKKLTDERRTPSDGSTSHGPLGQVS
jgi:hypothetical protein